MIYRFIKWLVAPLVFDLMHVRDSGSCITGKRHPLVVRHLKSIERKRCRNCKNNKSEKCKECTYHPEFIWAKGMTIYNTERQYEPKNDIFV